MNDDLDWNDKPTRQRFYDSAEWQRTRRIVLIRQLHLCQNCHGRASVVDHIVDIAVDPSRRLDITNLRAMCPKCHNRKTNLSDRHPGRKVSSMSNTDGTPSDPDHPWNRMKNDGNSFRSSLAELPEASEDGSEA